MTEYACEDCKRPIAGIMRGTGTGVVDERCWNRRHPFVPKTDFRSVLNNGDDQVLVRELLMHYVPEDIKTRIVEDFNITMQRRRALADSISEKGEK